jgi:fructose-1,6-bisphosphatase/inositol monophosphatase family enzyme
MDIGSSLQAMEEALRQNGPIILKRAGSVASTDKDDGSPVTDTDVEVEENIKASVAQRSNIPVYGEEGGYEHDLPETFWLVDPIDGTKSFVEGTPTFTSMAALIHQGETVASLIYNPSTDVMYKAQKGGGAFRNGEKLELAKLRMPGRAFCKEHFIEPLNGMLEPAGIVCEDAPSGGGYGFTMVAQGEAAARFNLHSGGHTHDYAPGALLVSEAGGVLIPVLDDEYTYETRSFVACHPGLERLVRELVPRLRELEAMPRQR